MCLEGWIYHRGHCYKLYPAKNKTWHEANNICQKDYTSMLSIHEKSFNDFILTHFLSLYNDTIWIGLLYNGIRKQFSWSDGSNVTFQNFGTESNLGKNGGCAAITKPRGEWQIRSCTSSNSFICMYLHSEQSKGMTHFREIPL